MGSCTPAAGRLKSPTRFFPSQYILRAQHRMSLRLSWSRSLSRGFLRRHLDGLRGWPVDCRVALPLGVPPILGAHTASQSRRHFAPCGIPPHSGRHKCMTALHRNPRQLTGSGPVTHHIELGPRSVDARLRAGTLLVFLRATSRLWDPRGFWRGAAWVWAIIDGAGQSHPRVRPMATNACCGYCAADCANDAPKAGMQRCRRGHCCRDV